MVPSNHVVTIVGWDDSYNSGHFISGKQPPGNGAWIVKNSWGGISEPFPNYMPGGWGIDGEGYFYLSYYDKSISFAESFDFYTEDGGQQEERFLIDQYDYMPSSGVTSVSVPEPVSMANVFAAREAQFVRSFSCETGNPNTKVTYELYRLKEGYKNPKDGTLLTTVSETYPYGGYHRIRLNEEFFINKGQSYSVIVTQQAEDGYKIIADNALNQAGMGYANSIGNHYTNYAVGIINTGESFVFSEGNWQDWKEIVAEIQRSPDIRVPVFGTIYDYDNLPIKAYSAPIAAPIDSISLDKTALSLNAGAGTVLKAAISPANATIKDVIWVSSNPAAVTVDEQGKVTALRSGIAVITVTTVEGNHTAACAVTVNGAAQTIAKVTPKPVFPAAAVKKITLNKTAAVIKAKKSVTLHAAISPANAAINKVTWKSSKPSVARVSSAGKVTGLKKGKSVITAKTNGKKAVCRIYVNGKAVKKIKLNRKSFKLNPKKSVKLHPVISPPNASHKKVTWKSSKPSIAKVSAAGKVTARKKGRAVITCITEEGKKKAKVIIRVRHR